MSDEQDLKVPPYSRWHILSKVSPSGKAMFVCLVCGMETVAPGKKCLNEVKILNNCGFEPVAGPTPVYVEAACHDVEAAIVRNRTLALIEHRKMDLAELALKRRKPCCSCLGWGCNACGGWGEPTRMRRLSDTDRQNR